MRDTGDDAVTGPAAGPRPGCQRRARHLIEAALGWTLALAVLAIFLPIATRSTSAKAPRAPGSPAPVATPAPNPRAGTAPVPRSSLVHADGLWVLLVIAGLAALVACVAGALYVARRTNSRWPTSAAWVLAAAVTAAAVLGALTVLWIVGLFVIPVGVLLLAACANTQPATPG